jgi:integral membrane sensor domain MASE1
VALGQFRFETIDRALLALGSEPFGYRYGEWWPGIVGSLAILGASAFLTGRDGGTALAGAGTGAGVALVDVFVGWPLSGVMVPGYFPTGTLPEVISTVAGVGIVGAALGATIGFVAGSLGARSQKRTLRTG